MKYSTSRINILCLLGLCLLLFKTAPTEAQNKRTSRVTSSRSFGTNIKTDTSNGPSFDCPEEFGYYPHPSDCTQYYVCVFGGALLESCTGGLMYSHDLQTCDWPRNVGCELADTSSERNLAQSQVQRQREPHAQHVPSRVRFGAAFSSQGGTQKTATVPPQYHRSPPQVIQAQVQNIPPPPPELRVSPNPVITSRGQPKPLIDSQEDIAKLYADAQESLPPVEEEESDRQQRVYRGQPSTVSQVQRDRDGIIHQASINSIPQTGKIGSYAFGTAYSESLQDDHTHELSYNRLDESRRRKRRDLSAQPTKVSEEKNRNDSNCSSVVFERTSPTALSVSTETSNISYSSQERLNDGAPAIGRMCKYSSKIRQLKSENAMEFDYKEIPGEDSQLMEGYEDEDDVATGESKRRPRQLRPISHTSLKWPGQNYRAIDAPPLPQVSQQAGYSFGNYNPYLTPPNTNPVHNQQPYGNPNYNHLPGYHSYVHQQQQLASAGPFSQKKHKLAYTGYNLSLPPPPLEDDFRPIAGSYYEAAGAAQTSPRSPNSKQHHSNAGDLLPYLIQQLKELKEQRKHQSDNFAYFRLDNQPISPVPNQAVTPVPTISTTYYSPVDPSKLSQQVTSNGQYSTMGGFYNNQKPGQASFNPNYPGKLISQYSIASNGHDSTTESNYFQYNIVANQKMKGVFSTAPPNQIDHSAVKVRPPVTPLHVTQSINVVSAPNLTYRIPNRLQQAPFALFPEGISYAINSTIPESYQTFTKSVSTSATLLADMLTTTPKSKLTNFQFNINEFMANLKESDLASVNPAVNPLIKYLKDLSTDDNGNKNLPNPLVNRRPVTGSTSTLNSTATTPQVDITPNTPAYKKRIRPEPTLPTQSTPTTMRILKGYEHFIKGIQNQLNSRNSSQSTVYNTSTTLIRMPTTTTIKSVDYYDEDYEEDDDILPPSQMPPYMPVSETMAPPRRHLATVRPNTESPGKGPANFQTGFLEATTTRRPFPNFTQEKQAAAEADVPSFISFPSDIFQELKQRLPKLPESNAPQSSTKILTTPRSVRPTSHPRPIASSTEQQSTRVRYTTIRPRIRGQQKWNTTSPVQEQKEINNHTESNTVVLNSSKQSNPGGIPLNSIHAGSSPERHRNNNRNRGSAMYSNQDRDVISTPNRGTHPPRTRPTLKPSGTIVSKAQEFVDIYRYPPSRPDPIYPQPMPDKTAAKCRKDVCLLPDCYCGGRDIPGELPVESIPQIVLLTFDDSVNDLNKQLYTDLFEKGRVNPNGCPITATFYVSHEWTDYSQVQNLYADGHEMASHTVSHSFGEQFSQKKWTREIAGQREILAAYGGVKMSDVRGMRAPFLSVGGNKMYKMLYDSNFTYDSSMPVYENRPPSWPYTLDYKIFHDCMIPPCPTRSYPGVWQVPMVMWQDLNGGRCSMGDACSNPSDADGVTKMIMKNFERHYTTNRAPFGLFYHAAWFTQPHHKEGFIKFLDAINAMQDVWIITNWQALQWVRDPTPISRINSFQPFQCDYSDRPKRCNNPKVCNLWHKSGVRYMKTCQPCPDIYPWTGKSGIRSSRIDNEVEEPAA
uniref:Chitin deacetylase-like 5, isoform F n=1 Tax=Drosophila melanogaster TaxID=7227 RepID=M9NEJ4_DROME|nr:chitin deacetylase-like 5, isoform F [Drosophila melanogaster]AFH03482.1 chitin deacetylase-like 5, isoform F [Drosophila melanogaster]|eukprot:NP_001245805.1 chitin deacetylase-like 5, isoform F [Drosophila melanogaster]